MNILVDAINDTSYFEVFEYYFGKFGSNSFNLSIWLEFSIVLILGFLVRGYLLIKYELDRIDTSDKKLVRKMRIYCINHTAYEFIISYIICFALINFAGANPHAIFVNIAICPGTSFLLGLVIDNKIIMKLEENSKLNSNPKSDESTVLRPEIPVEVYSGENEENIDGISKINLNTVESCDINLAFKIINTLNDLIDSNNNYNDNINKLETKISLLENIIIILKNAEKNDKQIEIKSLIYKCLNNGFATPEQDANITNKYNSYMALVENNDPEIYSLYNNRYLKLNVHEDRRKNSIPVENDRRKNNKIKYGEFDEEIFQGQ